MDELIYMGRVIRKMRMAKGLTQEEMSLHSEVNLSYYSKIERGVGNPTIKKIFAILMALDVTPEEYWERVALEKGITPKIPYRSHIFSSEK